jgi:outer membrane protein assembly factor BamB
MLAGYAVPVICKANGREDLVIAGSGKMKGYDPKTGKELWQCNTLLRTIMTTPIVDGENIYMTCQSYGDTDRVLKFALLQWKDTDQDGRLDKKEIDEPFWEKFDKGDADKDGYLVDDEIDNAFQAETNRVGGGDITQMIKGGGLGDVTDSHLVWNVDEKTPSNIASALVYDDQLFMVKKGGICASYDKKSGENIFMKRRLNNFGNYYASPVAGDGKVYVQGENGFLLVVKLGEEPEVLAKNDMGDSVVATPAIADGRIFVRTLNTIYCFSKEASE